jgi:RNA polymerase sigma factor (sigma-70 family)
LTDARRLPSQRSEGFGDAVAADSPARPTAPLDYLEQLRRDLCIFVAGNFNDPSQVEDVVQETLIRLLSCKCANESTLACAKGIARHVICDISRLSMRERRVSRRSLDRIGGVYDSPRSDPLRRVAVEEAYRPVERELAKLSPFKRYVLEECYFQDRKCAEIARRNGIRADQVRKVKSRALHDLRERLHHPPRS